MLDVEVEEQNQNLNRWHILLDVIRIKKNVILPPLKHKVAFRLLVNFHYFSTTEIIGSLDLSMSVECHIIVSWTRVSVEVCGTKRTWRSVVQRVRRAKQLAKTLRMTYLQGLWPTYSMTQHAKPPGNANGKHQPYRTCTLHLVT